jgi:hypothetical protein
MKKPIAAAASPKAKNRANVPTALAFSNSLAVLGARDSNELSIPSNRS